MPIFSRDTFAPRRLRRLAIDSGRAKSRAVLVAAFTGLALAACSAAPSAPSPEPVGKTVAPLDRPGAVFTPTQYTITLSEVDVQSAVEPPNGICGLNTPDTGYIDWAELGVQVNSDTPVSGACTLNDANGQPGAGTGAKLVQCGTLAANNSIMSEGKPLAVSFNATGPNDNIQVGLAIDNIESTNQAATGQLQTKLPNYLSAAKDAIQLVGTLAFAAAGGVTAVPAVIGLAVSVVGGSNSLSNDLQPSTSMGTTSTVQTSCVGGLLGNPKASAYSSGGLTYDAPPPDTMYLTFTPAQLDDIIAKGSDGAGFAGCPPGGCNAIDFYPTMTGLSSCENQAPPNVYESIYPGDVGFPGGGPRYDFGCSSKLHLRVTVSRNWATGPAASAKSPDMAVAMGPATLVAMQPDPVQNFRQMVSFLGSGPHMQFDGVSPEGTVWGGSIPTTPTTIPALVSRTNVNADGFYVANDVLFTTYMGPQTNDAWQTSALSFAPAKATVTAAARTRDTLDVLMSSTDGNVWDTYWSAQAGKWNQLNATTQNCVGPSWTVTSNSAPCTGSAVPGGGIAVVALNPGNLNSFYIGTDGGIWNTWWVSGGGFYTYEIVGPSSPFQNRSGVATPGGNITAVARTATNIDVYYIGTDGSLWTSTWQNGASWGSRAISPSSVARAGTPISAVARQPYSIDVVFETPATGPNNGSVEWASWSTRHPWTFAPVPTTSYETPNNNGADALSILAPTSFSLQLFYLDVLGHIETVQWTDQGECNEGSFLGCTWTDPTNIMWGNGAVVISPE